MIRQPPRLVAGDDARRPATDDTAEPEAAPATGDQQPAEVGGRDGPDPTRYGDWEKGGRCIDF